MYGTTPEWQTGLMRALRAKIRDGFARTGRFCWDHPCNAFLRLVMVALWPVITFAVIPALPHDDYLTTVSLDESTRTATLGLLLLAVITPKVIKGLSDVADRVIASFTAAIERVHAELREDAAQQSDAVRQDLAVVTDKVLAAAGLAARTDGEDPPLPHEDDRTRSPAGRRLRIARDDDDPRGGLGSQPVRRAGFAVSL
jgi:hypothetical protein